MEAVIQWVKNIVYYLIFISLVFNLLPKGKYEQYIRLFSGAVFLLVALAPLTGGLKLDEQLAFAYERLRFRQDAREFEEKLWGIEDRQISQVIRRYEEAVSKDIQEKAWAEGFACREARVEIEGREGEESFGKITRIQLVLEKREEGQSLGGGFQVWEDEEEAVIVAAGREGGIAPVEIKVEEASAGQEGYLVSQWGKGRDEDGRRYPAGSRQEELYGFQRKVAKYYGLEEKNIQIAWKDEERELDSSAVPGADFDDRRSAP